MSKEIKLPIPSGNTREYFYTLNGLENSLSKGIGGTFWRTARFSVGEIVEMNKQIGIFHRLLWEEIGKHYPQIIGRSASINGRAITYTEEETV